MAYLLSIERKCRRCGKRATVQVVDFRNDPRGDYCAKCGNMALAVEEEREKRIVASDQRLNDGGSAAR